MDISIVIVNYNTKILIKQCLQSVLKKTKDINYEIIVVDNASYDGLQAMLKKEFPQVKLIESSENLGFGKANNLGAKYASGKYLLLLNPDTILLNNAVKILFDFMEKNPNCGICGGNLYDENNNPVHSFGRLLGIGKELRAFFSLPATIEFNTTEKAQKVGYITGADLMINRRLFNNIGYFDEEFFMYYEDVELTYRVKREGFDVYSIPQSKIMHLEGKSSNNKQKKQWDLTSKKLYYQKTHSKFYVEIANAIFALTILSRCIVYKLLGNKGKFELWQYQFQYFKHNTEFK